MENAAMRIVYKFAGSNITVSSVVNEGELQPVSVRIEPTNGGSIEFRRLNDGWCKRIAIDPNRNASVDILRAGESAEIVKRIALLSDLRIDWHQHADKGARYEMIDCLAASSTTH